MAEAGGTARLGFSRGKQRGLTLVELIVAFTILLLLTTMAHPLARFKVRRERGKERRWALAEMRKAIDKCKDASSANLLPPGKIDSDGYPGSLQQLVDGVRPNAPFYARAGRATPVPEARTPGTPAAGATEDESGLPAKQGRAERHLPIRARGSTGWTGRAARYDSGL